MDLRARFREVEAQPSGGAWSYNVYPDIQTAYQARFRTVSSGEVSIQVRPHVRLLGSRKYLFAKVISSYSFATPYADTSEPMPSSICAAGPLTAAPPMIGLMATTWSRRCCIKS